MYLDTRCHPEAFARVEAAVFPDPWPASSFGPEPARLHFSLWRERVCLAFLYASVVLDEAEILRVATLPGERGQGHAQKLLHALQTRCRELEVTRIFLDVSHLNHSALSFYRKAGFREQGRRRDYYGPGEDALSMVCAIPLQ